MYRLLFKDILQLLQILSNVLGTVALVFYTFPYLGIIFAPLSVLYYVYPRITGEAQLKRNA